MTWIKTIPQKEADEKLRSAMQRYKQMYPIEYRNEVEILKLVASRETGGSIRIFIACCRTRFIMLLPC